MNYFNYLLASLVFVACTSTQSQDMQPPNSGDFNRYWYGGQAELTSYELQQARYGEIHKGEAVLVFVTEPFSKSKQVKLDNWRDQSPDNVSVLKLNMTKKFLTGIYPYSMMMSTFKPVSSNQYPNAFKISTSSQEWCGHTFMQLNLEENNYRLKGFSYFESEGDVNVSVPGSLVEDEIWTTIRLNPANLPTGDIELLPSTFYLRLRHQETKPQQAKASLTTVASSDFGKSTHSKYMLEYTNRSLAIYFESAFPYQILGWEETHQSGFGKKQALTTVARRINTIQSPYWSQNSNKDRALRKELGLSLE
ncbi:MAG: septum formation inhibitor Maf [Bacteroidota bacterium]